MKKKTVRGLVLFPVVAGVLIFVGGAVVGAGAMYLYGRTHSGGLGDSMEAGINLAEPPSIDGAIMAETEPEPETTEPETTEPPTEPLTEPVTEALGAMTVVIDGNSYYYRENPIELDELTAILHYVDDENLTVRIIKDNASRNASTHLKNALRRENIPYIEENRTVTSPEPTEFH